MDAIRFEDLGNGKFALHGALTFSTATEALQTSKDLFADHARIELDLGQVGIGADEAGEQAGRAGTGGNARRQEKRGCFGIADVQDGDSAGLAVLLEWVNWAKNYVREIRYINVPDEIVAIAQISEVDDMLTKGERWTGII